MRDSMEMTVKYQFLRMLLMELAAIGIAALFGMFIFFQFASMNIVKYFVSAGLIGVEFAIIYTASKKLAVSDGKTYTPLHPNKIKGAFFGAQLSLINALFTAAYIIVWHFFSDASGIQGAVPIAVNAVYYVWTYAYNGFIIDSIRGIVGPVAIALMIIMPIAASTLGYIAGTKKFDITEKMDIIIYEQEDNSNEHEE